MEYREEDWLQIAGLHHFSVCRRRWALVHIEQQWEENLRTTEGHILHERAHDASQTERRGDLLIVRDLRVFSAKLGVSGACDVVEFRKDPTGVPLRGEEGLWRAMPVEYKHGESMENDADRLQLCAQAMCLEQMLGTKIPAAALFYAKTRRREKVELDDALREKVCSMLAEMHDCFHRGYTPQVKPGRFCSACSMKELCLPKLCRKISAADYLNDMLGEENRTE